MENKNRQTNKLSIFFKTLAFSVFFTGLTSGCATPINNHKEETKIESNEEIEVDDVEVKEDDEYSKLLIDELDNYSIIDYKGNSLAEALTLCGYDISFETRKSLAETFGIDDYTGTIKQDNELLNILKENKIESLAKVSDIKDICKKLFKYDQDKIIEYLKLPKTLNITRSDFSRVIREIAGKLNVDINYDNDKLSTALDNVKDVNKLSMNRNNIAWAYLMGYMDLDDNYNFNGNEYVTVKDFNLWLKTFTNDYNKAIEKQTNNDKKIIIAPSKDIVNIKDKEVENKTPEDNNKDNKTQEDKTTEEKVNDNKVNIDNKNNDDNKVNTDNKNNDDNKVNTDNKNNDDNKVNTDNNQENNKPSSENKHKHKYNVWKYFDQEKEISTCDKCDSKSYRNHKFNTFVKKLFTSNNNGTHKVSEIKDCLTCDGELKNEYDSACNLTDWTYNQATKQEERGCDSCEYKETKQHNHTSAPANLQYNFYKSNNNGTHKLKAVYNCSICNESISLVKDVNCSMSGWVYNSSTKQEEKSCGVCGHKETRQHNHTGAPANLQYNFYKSNNNGTHKLKAVYNCDICREPITLVKDVNCSMGSWEYNPTTKKEEKSCSVCGHKETKEHIHQDAPANLQYTYDKSNYNGTHKLKAVYNCGVCNESITLVKDVNCSMSEWVYNSTTKKEEKSCSVCDYKETKEHIHQDAPANLEYTFDSSNNDGTHKLKAVYNCNVCNESITLVKNENCGYGSWRINDGFTCIQECNVCGHDKVKEHSFATVAGSVTTNPTMGVHNQTEKCNDCSYEKQVEVSCNGNGNKYYNRNGDVVTIRENCSVCGDVCKDDVHNHELGSYSSVDDTNHKRSCDCGYESVEGHGFSDWVIENGQKSATCNTCGHTKTESHTCEVEHNRVFPSSKTGDYCYEDVSDCIVDGCDYRESNRVGHDYKVESDEVCALYTCRTCNYKYEEIFDFLFLSPEEENIEENEEEQNKQLILN